MLAGPLLSTAVYCHQPWNWLWPSVKNKRDFCLLMLHLRTQVPCEFGGSPQHNHLHSSQACTYTKVLLHGPCGAFVNLGTLQVSDSECFSSQNQGAECLWPSCRNRLPSARFPWNLFFVPRKMKREAYSFCIRACGNGKLWSGQNLPCNSFSRRIPIPLSPGCKQSFGKNMIQWEESKWGDRAVLLILPPISGKPLEFLVALQLYYQMGCILPSD